MYATWGFSMVIELRRYSVVKGRMPDMHLRMRDMLMPLFEQHGVPRPTAAWESSPDSSASVFTWIVRWPSYEVRRSTWIQFRPVWEAARAARGGDEFVTRTDLTLMEPWPAHDLEFPARVGACEELWLAQPRVGFGAAFRKNCLDTQFKLFENFGAISTAACDLVFGTLPQVLILITWPSEAVRSHAMAHLARPTESPDIAQAVGASIITENGVWEPLDRVPYLVPGS
jgi:hypothetical protein